jgi:hypothetical protein
MSTFFHYVAARRMNSSEITPQPGVVRVSRLNTDGIPRGCNFVDAAGFRETKIDDAREHCDIDDGHRVFSKRIWLEDSKG